MTDIMRNQFVYSAMNLYKQGMLDYESMCEAYLVDSGFTTEEQISFQAKVLDKAQECFEKYYLKEGKSDDD